MGFYRYLCRRCTRGLAVFAFACGVLPAAFAQPVETEVGQRLRLTPEQRRDLWERMTPEQREQWRRSRSSDERQRLWSELSPQQRRDTWEQLSPEQRELMLRRLPPEQRDEMLRKMTPGEREAMRQRFVERDGARGERGGRGPRHMSIEERRQLREQIEQARGDVYREREGERRRGPHRR